MKRLYSAAQIAASIDFSAVVAGAASFTYAVATITGLPVLRHDWGADPFHSGWREIIAAGFGGWDPSGIGRPWVYPDAYLITPPIALLTALGGNRGALFVFLLATGALAAFGGRAAAKDAGGRGTVASATAIFCVFNPWTYTELVAGHVFMLLAYAASIWFFREMLKPSPRSSVLIGTSLLTLQQPQFLAVCTLVLLVFALKRRVWLPFAVAALAWLPIAIGLLSDSSALNAIPFITSWEREQSITPLDALQLNGYFTGYADSFNGFFALPVLATAGLAAGSLLVVDRRRLILWTGTAAALLIAMGLRGPLATPFTWLIHHTRLVAFYRELFDLLAFVAIGYALLAVVPCARRRVLAFAWLAIILVLPTPWLASPPARYWATAEGLPSIAVPAPTNARFVLVPAFQPMSYGGRGSGRDPDLHSLPNNVTPLNEAFSTYPSNAALGAFLIQGNTAPLQALSVATVLVRPWLRTETDALAQQWALPFHGFPPRSQAQVIALVASPELALLAMPAVGALDAHVGDGNIFFGDAAAARGPLVPMSWLRLKPVHPIVPPNEETKAARAWVDARLAFGQAPELAQSLGGALTTNSSAVLTLRGGAPALVYVSGALRSVDGRTLARGSGGYRWIEVPPSVSGVKCLGLCLVAARGDPPAVPLEPAPHVPRALTFQAITPWLVMTDLPAGPPGALRYNTSYDAHWSAYLGSLVLTHLRLDGVANGWLLPASPRPQTLILLETTAAAEVVSEVVVLLALSCFAIAWLKEARATKLVVVRALRTVRSKAE